VQGLSWLCVWVWFSVEHSVVNMLVITRWRGGRYYWNKLCGIVFI